MGRFGEDHLIDAWPVVSYTVGAALEQMALLDVEAEQGVLAAVKRGRCRRERDLSKISGGCHVRVGDERGQHSVFTIHYLGRVLTKFGHHL